MFDESPQGMRSLRRSAETNHCRTGDEHQRRNLFGSTFFGYEKGGIPLASNFFSLEIISDGAARHLVPAEKGRSLDKKLAITIQKPTLWHMHSSHSKVFVVLALSTLVILSSCKKQDEQKKETMVKSSFVDLMKLGKNYSCRFTRTDKGTTVAGMMYIEGKDKGVRGDFTMTKDGKSSESHLIRTGDTMYMWTSIMPKGMKMTLSAEDTSFFGKNNQSGQVAGMNEADPMDFSCSGWTVDSSLFTPPSDITFSDMTEQMKSIQNMMKDGAPKIGKDCSICDRITGDTAKAQCKQAMGC